MRHWTFARVVAAYTIFFLLLASPFWLQGEVLAPTRQAEELGITAPAAGDRIENRKFSDYPTVFVPEVVEHLESRRSGWLTLWTAKSEVGRPTYHISGFSPAYALTWLIRPLVGDAWELLTVLSLSFCYLAGLFGILFCREAGLEPLAGLVAGASLAGSPLLMYWLTFPMFPAVWCWAAGAIWGLARLQVRPDAWGGFILAFSSYSLLMSGYPQVVVFHGYLLAGLGLHLAFRKFRASPAEGCRFAACVLAAVAYGTALAAPAYLDLLHLSSESARVAPDAAFFSVVVPVFATAKDLWQFVSSATFPEFFGNPISPAYPLQYNGISIPALPAFFVVLGVLAAWRQTWGWLLGAALLGLFALVPAVHAFGVKYLGFNLSRATPLGTVLLPATIVAAYGANALVSRSCAGMRSAVLTSSIIVGVLAASAILFAISMSLQFRWSAVVVSLAVIGLLAFQRSRTRSWMIILALGSGLASVSAPLMLHQPPGEIRKTSPFVEAIRSKLEPGARYAVVSPGVAVLPPNMNSAVDLSSVHSYNSLSPTRYRELIRALGGEVHTYGRWNGSIAPDYASATFWMSNIALVLSREPIRDENLQPAGEESGVRFYKVVARMGEAVQVVPAAIDSLRDHVDIGDPRRLPSHEPKKLVDQGDVVEYRVAADAASLLLLSRKYHRDWQATGRVQGHWEALQTTEVNRVFQGVILPPGTDSVRLEFKPYVRHAWLANACWLALLALVVLHWVLERARSTGKGRVSDV